MDKNKIDKEIPMNFKKLAVEKYEILLNSFSSKEKNRKRAESMASPATGVTNNNTIDIIFSTP